MAFLLVESLTSMWMKTHNLSSVMKGSAIKRGMPVLIPWRVTLSHMKRQHKVFYRAVNKFKEESWLWILIPSVTGSQWLCSEVKRQPCVYATPICCKYGFVDVCFKEVMENLLRLIKIMIPVLLIYLQQMTRDKIVTVCLSNDYNFI